MANKMLIDAAHPEETRVVVVRGNRVEEFDFESASRRQLRGNIYLAKVTRVEPSLQAAFVDYGGNRHGFLAFSEIHPDYYQIPVADRQALIEAEAARDRRGSRDAQARRRGRAIEPGPPTRCPTRWRSRAGQRRRGARRRWRPKPRRAPAVSEPRRLTPTAGRRADRRARRHPRRRRPTSAGRDGRAATTPRRRRWRQPASIEVDGVEVVSDDRVESVGAEDAMEEVPERRKPRARQYKIQEVIKRRQVLLVQVVKEERGNKGAALTTYLSLAGRYSVLMPNTARGGGIRARSPRWPTASA